VVDVLNTTVVVDKIRSGEIDAAIIPSRLASTYNDLNIVMTTEPVPHMGFSASPDVPADVVDSLRTALLSAQDNPGGKKMLEALRLEKLQPADASTYAGFAGLLQGVYGYDLGEDISSIGY